MQRHSPLTRARLCCFLTILPLSALPTGSPERMLQSAVRVLCKGEDLSTGSGFVVGAGDHVVTNWHVVACAAQGGTPAVYAKENAAVQATVRWKSEQHDLALLQFAQPLDRPPAEFATQETVIPGDVVWAVGFPGEADTMAGTEDIGMASLTKGVVSRAITSREGVALYQIDASLNPGNSGGPLFNDYGQVVGINVAKSLALVPIISAEGGGNLPVSLQRLPLGEGIGWAIQSDELLPQLEALAIPYQAHRRLPNALVRLWRRDPLLSVSLLTLLGLSGLALWLATTRQGRQLVVKAVEHSRQLSRRQGAVSQAAAKPVLQGLSGPYAGAVVEIGAETVAIGRDPRVCQLVFPSDTDEVGRRHCTLRYDAGAGTFWLEDHWSANGTYVDGNRIPSGEPQRLAPDTRFYLSDPSYTFVVKLEH